MDVFNSIIVNTAILKVNNKRKKADQMPVIVTIHGGNKGLVLRECCPHVSPVCDPTFLPNASTTLFHNRTSLRLCQAN